MENKNAVLVLQIEGHDAIPVRAIPYITGWTLSPHDVARHLAKHEDSCPGWKYTNALHRHLGTPVEILPKEWDAIVVRLNAFSERLNEKFPNKNISREAWLDDAVAILPAGVFVWLDEFEQDFHRSFSLDSKVGYLLAYEREGDRELNYVPTLTDQASKIVLEGFETLPTNPASPHEASSMLTERHIWEIHFNDSSPVRWEAISKLNLIDRSKAIFWMYGLNPGRHAAITESLVDEDVSKIVPRRIKNVLGAEDFFRRVRDTLEQAASEKMNEATAAGWLAWATDRGVAVHSKFKAIADNQTRLEADLPLTGQAPVFDVDSVLSTTTSVEALVVVSSSSRDAGVSVVAESFNRLPSINGGHLQNVRQEIGRGGGQARAAKYAAVGDYAFKLANEGRYPSQRQAAINIQDRVRDYAKGENISMSEDRAQKTIENWLKQRGYRPFKKQT